MAAFVLNPYSLIAPTYSFTAPATASRYEGDTVTYTISTTRFSGTLYWTVESVSGTVSNADFSSPSNAVTAGGSVVITNNSGSFSLTLASDALTETESYRVRLRINSTSGEIVATSNTITISDPPTSESVYTTAGSYSWVAPTGVYSVSVVCVGGGGGGAQGIQGGGGGGGGGLGWKNSIAVTPGNSYTVVVGASGGRDTDTTDAGVVSTAGGDSYFISSATVAGLGGGRAGTPGTNSRAGGAGGGAVGDGGGSGGNGGTSGTATGGGGGGAGGYAGNGGAGGGTSSTAPGGNGSGGGAGGGAGSGSLDPAGGGGGVDIYGQGTNGAGGTSSGGRGGGGGGGSGGTDGVTGVNDSSSTPINGGSYGGGGGGQDWQASPAISGAGDGGVGAVRIIWGTGRSFPSNAA